MIIVGWENGKLGTKRDNVALVEPRKPMTRRIVLLLSGMWSLSKGGWSCLAVCGQLQRRGQSMAICPHEDLRRQDDATTCRFRVNASSPSRSIPKPLRVAFTSSPSSDASRVALQTAAATATETVSVAEPLLPPIERGPLPKLDGAASPPNHERSGMPLPPSRRSPCLRACTTRSADTDGTRCQIRSTPRGGR